MKRPLSKELLYAGAAAGGTVALAAAGFALSKAVEHLHERRQPSPEAGTILWCPAPRARLESPAEYAKVAAMPRGHAEAGYYAILGATIDPTAATAFREARSLQPVVVRHFPHGDGSHSYDIGTSSAFMRAANRQAAYPNWDGTAKVAVRITADPTLLYVGEHQEDGRVYGKPTDVIGVLPLEQLVNSKRFPGLVIAHEPQPQG